MDHTRFSSFQDWMSLMMCYKLAGFGAMSSGPTLSVQFLVSNTQGIFPFPDTPLGCLTHTLHTCFYYSFLLVCKAHFRKQLFWDRHLIPR